MVSNANGYINFPDSTHKFNTDDFPVDYESCDCTTECSQRGDYCRCTVLINMEMTPITAILASILADKYFVRQGDAYMDYQLAILFLKNAFPSLNDMFEPYAVDDYYGEVLGGIKSTEHTSGRKVWGVFREQLRLFNESSNDDRIKQILTLEYGYVLPAIKDLAGWQLQSIPVQDIQFVESTMAGVDDGVKRSYMSRLRWKDRNHPRALEPIIVIPVVKDKGKYRLIDGHHRFAAWITKPYNLTSKKWENMRKNKVINVLVPVSTKGLVETMWEDAYSISDVKHTKGSSIVTITIQHTDLKVQICKARLDLGKKAFIDKDRLPKFSGKTMHRFCMEAVLMLEKEKAITPPLRTQWEYMSKNLFTGTIVDTANTLGIDGWELVSVVKNGHGHKLFFKRPIL